MHYAFCGKHHLITPLNNKCYQYVQYVQHVQNVYILQYFFQRVVVQEEDLFFVFMHSPGLLHEITKSYKKKQQQQKKKLLNRRNKKLYLLLYKSIQTIDEIKNLLQGYSQEQKRMCTQNPNV